MAMVDNVFYDSPPLVRHNVTATATIAEGLVIAVDGGVCDASKFPLGVAYKSFATGDEIVTMKAHSSVNATTGAVVNDGSLVTSDANGKVVEPVAAGCWIIGIAEATSTGADETIKVNVLEPFWYKTV